MSIDLSNVIALTLGSDDVLQIQDAIGTVLWQKIIYYNVNISAGSNGTVSVNGVSGNYSQSVPSGTVLTIEGTGNTGYDFDEWSDGNTTNPRTITVTGDLTLTAVFESAVTYYNVSVSAGSNGTVSVNGVSGNYSQSVASGTVLTIEGTGDTGYNFDEWSDGNTTNPRTITVTGDLTLTAAFESAAPLLNYFYVEDASGSDNTLSISKSNASAPTIEVFKSTDGTNWSSMGTTSTTAITATIPANGKLYLRCSSNSWGYSTSNYCNKINTTGNCNVGGNIMSLLYGTNFTGEETTFPSGSSYNFRFLFSNNTHLVNASDLLLPATTLAEGCYRQMFQNCTSLTTAPTLPATTLAEGCYGNMFGYCTSLTTAPDLPATTLTEYCYSDMFMRCVALTTAPTLPATILVSNCYRSMFDSCTNLNTVITYASKISARNCLNDWLNGVSATGDFYNLGSATYTSGVSGIPSGWTEHTPSVPINVTIINTDSYTGATYQIDSETAQPVNVTGNTTFTVPTTATTLTVNRNGKGETSITGVSGMSTDSNWITAIPVQDMSSNVTIEFISLM